MAEQATAAGQVTAAVDSMRKESDQAARAMSEQARAMKDITSATANITRQMRLLSGANKEHTGAAARVLGQLRTIRAVTDRNSQGVRDTLGNTNDLVAHAEALRDALRIGKGSSNGRKGPRKRIERPRMIEPSEPAREPRIGVFTTDTDLIVKSWDESLSRMTGISAARACGQRLEALVPDLTTRLSAEFLREPLVSGAVQVLAPAFHKYLIPCAPLEPSTEFDRMQQRVVIGPLRNDEGAVGLIVTVEDVTWRLHRERQLSKQLRDGSAADRIAAVRELAELDDPGWPRSDRICAVRRRLAGAPQRRAGAGHATTRPACRCSRRRAARRSSQLQPVEQRPAIAVDHRRGRDRCAHRAGHASGR